MKSPKIKTICILLISIVFLNTSAQNYRQSTFSFNYNYQIPIGNLANSFGNSSAIGGSFLVETRSNVLFGFEVNYLFGDNIKDSTIFNNISTSNGAIIGADGYYANINVMQRGFDCYLFTGYAFHLTKNNLSGIYLSQGIGYLQHQIFINTKNQDIPQLNEEMKEGYDRFSSGFSTKLSIDYKYYHKKGRFQISSGVNYTMAYSKNQRTYDFANNSYYSNKTSLDQLLGYKIEIIIPIQRKNEEKFHYF
tara:strand:+ start:29989 stop:30735 length:747 start_codon:yes stop_codon:yes gene_type:complete